MANEGIRLPRDTTVASQKVHRGSTAQDTQVRNSDLKEPPQPKILATVVLQSKTLIEGSRGGLFELILQNDPRSDPPIRLTSDTLLKPGTPLLIELDKNNEYRPVDKPTQQQLKQLIQLELDFWRAHLLPKAGNRAFPPVPDTPTLLQIASQFPTLKPLIQWITQQPEQVTGREIMRWLREASPLSQQRSWPTEMTSGTTRQPPLNNPAAGATRMQATPADSIILPARSPIPLLNPRLLQPIGTQSEQRLAPMPTPGTDPARPAHSSTLPLPHRGWQYSGQLFQWSGESKINNVPAAILHASLLSVRQTATQSVLPTAMSPVVPSPAPVANTATMTPSAPTTANASPAGPTGSVAANVTPTVAQSPVLTLVLLQSTTGAGDNRLQVAAAPVKTDASATMTTAPLADGRIIAPETRARFQPLPNPVAISGRTATELPLEVRLTMWLSQLDQTIQRQPTQLNQQVQAKAQDALQNLTDTAGKISQSSGGSPANETRADESQLLSLRNWIDATLARLQHNAVQLAAHQISQPDQPIQQMQLPLIWLGLTSWADIEWWQERPTQDQKKKNDRNSTPARWRMKIYLTLTPMAKVCADIDWSEQQTQLTFWSEDAATLNHLNQMLPTLTQWTEGLGERQMTTKHGMPARQAAPQEPEPNHHLVDIKT